MRLPALMLTAAGVIVGAALVAAAASAEPALGPPPFAVPGGRLKLEFCADDIVRVAYAPSHRADAFFARPTRCGCFVSGAATDLAKSEYLAALVSSPIC